jgi:Ca2+-transporting ATPase
MTPPDTFHVSPDELDALDARLLRKHGGLDGLVAKLHTHSHNGIDDGLWAARKLHFGDNHLPPPPSKSFFQFMFLAMQDKMLLLLCAASIASLGLGIYQRVKLEPQSLDFVEGVAILGTVLIIVLASSAVDYTKQDKFKKLNAKNQERRVKVRRAGEVQEILVFDLFVGDVVLFEAGNLLPADGVLIEGHNVCCDESSATGESDVLRKTPVKAYLNTVDETKKASTTPFMIAGSRISEGVGSYLITAVGMRTTYGKMMASVQQEAPKTPLQVKLDKFAGESCRDHLDAES